MMNLQQRIKKRRLQKNLSLLEVAQFLGVSEATAQRYESGAIKNIKHETIVRLAEVLKCHPAYLMGWELDEDEKKEKEQNANTAIASKIKALSDKELDLEKMAGYANVTVEEFQTWLDGKDSPTIGQLQLLGRMYSKPVSYFIDDKASDEDEAQETMLKQYKSLSIEDKERVNDYVELLSTRNKGGK